MCTTRDVFGDLAAVIEELAVPVDPDSLVEAIALRDRLDARNAEATGASRPAAGEVSTRRHRWPPGYVHTPQ